MRVPTYFNPEQRSFIERQLAPKTEEREQVTDTVVVPDLDSLTPGVLTTIRARTETKVYLRVGTQRLELTATEV